ncbi:ATP-binding protein [Oleiharenicola lentus]|uniref:sensor histidine kinase n=1 Tax=Oleiharenicola lentus TaxID=2508720 RepID=UPI003F662ABC
MRSTLRLLIVAILLQGASPLSWPALVSETGRPLMQVFTPREYQADPLCQAVVQGSDGVMIIANNTAAIAFDGVQWQSIALPPASTGISQLVLGADGVTYAAGGSVLGYFEGPVGQKTYRSLRDALPEKERDGARSYVIAAGREGVYFTDGITLRAWRDGALVSIGGSLPPETELFSAAGIVYVKGNDASLARIEQDALVPVTTDPLLIGTDLVLIESLTEGALRVLTHNRGFLQVSANGEVTAMPTSADKLFAGKRVLFAQRFADGSCVVTFSPGSGGGGIFLSEQGEVQGWLDESSGLPNRNLRSLATDTEGGLWVGLEYGIARLDWPSGVTLFDPVNGLNGFVTSIARQENSLYASTLSGLHQLSPGRNSAEPAVFKSVLSEAVYGLRPDASGLLFRHQTKLGRITPRGSEILFPLPSAFGSFGPSKRDPQRLWVNTMQGLHSIYREGVSWRDEGLVPGFTEHVAGLLEMDDGTMWISSFERGLFRLHFRDLANPQAGVTRVQRYAEGHGLPEFDHCAVYSWHGKPIFLFDRSAHPYHFDPVRQKFAPLQEAAALPTNIIPNCWSSHPSGESLWFTTNNPQSAQQVIYRLRAGETAPQFLPRAIAETAGKIWQFQEETTPAGPVLWICSVNGLLRVELDRAFRAPTPLRVLLRAEAVDEGARLPADKTTPKFIFSAPRFQTGAAVEYQTRLVGADDDWSTWSTEHTRNYARLPRGDYRFEVRAKDADGSLSDVATLSFSLFPPWWKSTWAIVLWTLLAIATVVILTRALAVRALNRRLELLKAQAAVEQVRLRLARDLHDDIGSGLGRVILFAGEAERSKDDPAKLAASLDRMRHTAHDLVQHAREIVWAVSPQHDSVASLAERVGDYAMETIGAAGMRCETDIPVDLPAWPLRSDARHSLFLAVKETLHNCVKYSEARTVKITARVIGQEFTLAIADDGRGFAPGERRGSGHGLRNLAIRAEALGGSAEIASEPGRGTTVVLRIPITPSTA